MTPPLGVKKRPSSAYAISMYVHGRQSMLPTEVHRQAQLWRPDDKLGGPKGWPHNTMPVINKAYMRCSASGTRALYAGPWSPPKEPVKMPGISRALHVSRPI
jgi:hypothetical protein